jgi:copper chaperone CopZ
MGTAITIVLGMAIAIAFFLGLRRIYRNFAAGEPSCCGSGGCQTCSLAGGDSYGHWIDEVNKFDYRKSIDVDGMTCATCANLVKKALESVDGVAVAAVSVERKAAKVGMEHEVMDGALQEAIRQAGYKPGMCASI